MQYYHGTPPDMTHQSIDSYSLMNHAIVNPDVLPSVYELYRDEETPLTALLNVKGMKTQGLYEGFKNTNYKVVSSNVVQYAVRASDRRKSRVVAVNGVTFICDAYATEPGKMQSDVYVYLDNNWPGHKEVIEFNDNDTQAWVMDEEPPVEVSGAFRYRVRIVTTDKTEFIPLECLEEGAEVAAVSTFDIHDFSETGVEKYTFDSWGKAYMTLARLKYSYSGTAAAMKPGDKWVVHHGQKSFLTDAQDKMMRRAAQYHEYWNVFGKGTVSVDGEVLMRDAKGREAMAGQGLMHQGDGAYEYPYNKLSMRWLEGIMEDIDVRAGNDGVVEAAFVGGSKLIGAFMKLMADSGYQTQNNNVMGEGSAKGVNNNYAYYEFNGVRIVPKKWRWFDSDARPSRYLDDGTRKSSWDGIFVPLGKTSGGDNSVDLVQLRSMSMGEVNGIDKGGKMATSVDGTHVHVLFQTGIISRVKISKVFRKQ